jgi:hypothetical protein
MKVISFEWGSWRWYRGVGEIHMNKGRRGEVRKWTDAPLHIYLIFTSSLDEH